MNIENPNNHPSPPVSDRDQDNWEAEGRLRPAEDIELARLKRVETVAKQAVAAYDSGGGDPLDAALRALAMLVR